MYRSRRLAMVTCWTEIGFGFGSETKMKNEQWRHTRCPRADLFLIVVSSHRARAEALRRRPHHSVVHHHLSLAKRRATSSGGKEITILIVGSFLSFLGCTHAEALQRCRRCITLCDCDV